MPSAPTTDTQSKSAPPPGNSGEKKLVAPPPGFKGSKTAPPPGYKANTPSTSGDQGEDGSPPAKKQKTGQRTFYQPLPKNENNLFNELSGIL